MNRGGGPAGGKPYRNPQPQQNKPYGQNMGMNVNKVKKNCF